MAKGKGGFIGQDGLNAPDPATGVTGTAGNEQVEVSFTSPSDVGGADITGYRVQSNDGVGASGSASPITVTGLTNGTSYTFNVWAINPFGWSSPSDASDGVSPTPLNSRAVFGGGQGASGGNLNVMDYVDIATTGNATDFGDLTVGRRHLASASSASRGLFAWGESSSGNTDVIDYITIASAGNATDFGDMSSGAKANCTGASNETRAIFGGGQSTSYQYVTIATTGNSATFGTSILTSSQNRGRAGCSSSTRAIFAGGDSASNVIEYFTIDTLGNGTDFGDLTQSRGNFAGASNATRGLFFGGETYNTIDYITIASTGNATDFGDLSSARQSVGAAASPTRALAAGGRDSEYRNYIEYVTIDTTGNSVDFGDLTLTAFDRYRLAGLSGAHGGLS
jgi:hypothetical protein